MKTKPRDKVLSIRTSEVYVHSKILNEDITCVCSMLCRIRIEYASCLNTSLLKDSAQIAWFDYNIESNTLATILINDLFISNSVHVSARTYRGPTNLLL